MSLSFIRNTSQKAISPLRQLATEGLCVHQRAQVYCHTSPATARHKTTVVPKSLLKKPFSPQQSRIVQKPVLAEESETAYSDDDDDYRSEASYDKGSILFRPFEMPTTEFTGMRIVFLGTASNKPGKNRNTSCVALKLEGQSWLFDCGEGTQHQIMNCPITRGGDISKVFITHMHGDHVMGLPGVVQEMTRAKRYERQIFGPIGLRHFITTALTYTYTSVQRYRVFEMVPGRTQDQQQMNRNQRSHDALIFPNADGSYNVYEDEEMVVTAKIIKHTVPCFGYVVREKDKIGNLKADLLQPVLANAGVGMDQRILCFQQLKTGNDFRLPDGTVLKAEDYVGPTIKGRKIVFLGDTCDPYSLADIAEGADLVLHEATLADEERDKARSRGHSSPSMAGQFAKDIGAKSLIITHFGGRAASEESIVTAMVQQAKNAFGSDNVLAAHDFMTYDLPQRATKRQLQAM